MALLEQRAAQSAHATVQIGALRTNHLSDCAHANEMTSFPRAWPDSDKR